MSEAKRKQLGISDIFAEFADFTMMKPETNNAQNFRRRKKKGGREKSSQISQVAHSSRFSEDKIYSSPSYFLRMQPLHAQLFTHKNIFIYIN